MNQVSSIRCPPLLLHFLLSLFTTAASALDNTVLFVSNRDGHMQIYSMRPDGSDTRALTHSPGGNNQPAWSPDGNLIAFTSTRDGNPEIYVMSADGSNQRRLTHHPNFDGHPAWSPDGRHIGFLSGQDGNINIYVIAREGGATRPITQMGADRSVGAPTWSHDGRRLFFIAGIDGKAQIHAVKVDGSGLQDLSSRYSKLAKGELALSPDGQWLAYSERGKGPVNIHTLRADGGQDVALTDNTAENYSPKWSPDGRRITFVSSRDDMVRSEIYVMDADGRNAQNISHHPRDDFDPRWLDNQSILYVSLRDRYAQLYRAALDNQTESRRITQSMAFELEPTPYLGPVATSSIGTPVSEPAHPSTPASLAAK